jgi:hypothetical protein
MTVKAIKSFGFEFEFPGPRNPQRNRMVERKFQAFYGRIRLMLNGAGLEGELRDKIWKECVINVTYSSNIISIKSRLKMSCYMVKGRRYTKILKCLEKMEL